MMKIGADQVSIKIADHGSIAVEKDAGGKQEHHDEFDHDADVKTGFHISHGLTTEEAEELRKTWGLNELPEKKVPKWLIYLKGLWGPMPVMIWIAAIIELALENWADGGILLGILFTNATISYYETTKAGDAVAALKASLKPLATVKRDGKWQNMDASLLVPGDLVLLGSGSAVPADCIVNHGSIDVDQAALTGESLPVTMIMGNSPKMGSTVVRGEVEGTVEFTGMNTFFGKTASLLQTVDGLGHLQMLLLKIMGILVVLSLILCFTAFGYLMGHVKEDVKEALSFTVVLLVASIPVAIEIVVTTTLALGSRQLSVHGAIVTRLSCIEEMAGMNMLCSDKTGTLTTNKMAIQDYCPCFSPGMDRDKVLVYAALAAKWREPPRDALDTMVLNAANLEDCDQFKQLEFVPFDPTTKKTEATLRGPDGKVFKVTKGAPHVILQLLQGEHKHQVEAAVETVISDLASRGIRSLTVAKTDDEGQFRMLGILTFLDPPRPDTKRTIERALEYGVDVKMITGDHKLIAKEMCRLIGLNDQILTAEGLPSMPADGKIPKDLGEKYGDHILACDGFAGVFPEHKYLIVEALRQRGFATGMTGDGVNDAPALKRADVGIAVQGATDAARAAADIVLTQPGLSVVVEGIIISRQIFQRMKSFINYRISATLQLLVFFFIAVFTFAPYQYQIENSKKTPLRIHHRLGGLGAGGVEPKTPTTGADIAAYDRTLAEIHAHHLSRDATLGVNTELYGWPAFFSLPVLMLMLITLLNDGTLISIGYDYASPSPRPEKWNLPSLWLVSIVLGGIACVSSLIMVWACLDSYNPNGLFRRWGLPPIEYGKIVTAIYLKVSISDFLTLFSARVHEDWFWKTKPSALLAGCATASLGLSTLLACLWPDGTTDGKRTKGLARGEYRLWPLWIWIYCAVWWFIQDACKVACYKLLIKYDVFHYYSGKMVNAYNANDALENKTVENNVGRVEAKLLGNKLEHVQAAMLNVEKKSPGAKLDRASQNLGLYRKSLTGYQAADTIKNAKPEHAAAVIQDAEDQLAQAGAAGPEAQAAQAAIAQARQAADRLARVSSALQQRHEDARQGAANASLLQRLSGRAAMAASPRAEAGSSYMAPAEGTAAGAKGV